MASKRLGEVRGPLFVWLVLTGYIEVLDVLLETQGLTPSVAILGTVLFYGGALVFLAMFVAYHERRRSLAALFSSLGLRRTGTVRSILWSVLLLPVAVLVSSVAFGVLFLILGTPPARISGLGQMPSWYLWFAIIDAFVPVALVEEMFGRGYLLDRLLPAHPSTIRTALPAILLAAVLFTLWHLPSYVQAYGFSISWTVGILVLDVFPLSIVFGIAYVRAGTRNILGLIVLHFILDAAPAMVALASH